MHAPATPVAGPTRFERALRWLAWGLFALALALTGAYVALRTLVWPNLERWRPQIEQRLAEATGREVHIAALRTGFEGWRPWLVADDVSILDPDGVQALSVARARAVVSMRQALRGRFALALLEVDSPELVIERLSARRLRVGGFDIDLDAPGESDVFARLLVHRKIVLHAARIDAVDRASGQRIALSAVDVSIGSVGRRHRASVHIPQWGDIAHDVDVAIEFAHAAFEPSSDWRLWRGEAYLGVRSADLAASLAEWERWRELLDLPVAAQPVAIDSGRVGFRAWTQFDPDFANHTALKLEASSLHARFDGDPVPLAAIGLDARATHDAAGRTTLVFQKLEFHDEKHGSFDAISGEPMLRLGAGGEPLAVRISLGRFDAGNMLAWLHGFPLPADVRARIEPLRVEGRVQRLAFEWSAESGEAHASAEADFEHLSFAWHGGQKPRAGELRLPGFRNVSGHVRLTRAGGEARLNGQDAVLQFPGLFAEADVPLDQFETRATWTVDAPADSSQPPHVELQIESLRFANRDAAGEVSGSWRSGGRGAGIVDLVGQFERADASRTSRYLPLTIPANVRNWVRDAVRAGRSDHARFVLQGDLHDFPYRDPATGVFVVEATLANAQLAYAPGWPAIDRIGGTLRFERAGMEIDAQSGRVWNVALSDTRARIADFEHPVLLVEGSGAGRAQEMIRFVNESALRTKIDDFTREASATGDAKLQLALELPLGDLDAARVRGSVQFTGNDIVLDPALPPLEGLVGRLEFTEERLALRALRAKFLGGALQAQGDASAPGQLQIEASGEIPAASLARLRGASPDSALPARLAEALSGSIAFDARFALRERVASLTVDSDLVGVASALPEPFVKRSDERWPLHVEWVQAASGGQTLRVALRDDAQLVLERDPVSGKRRSERDGLQRAAVGVGAEAVLPDSGFAARVATRQLDLDAWSAFFDVAPSPEATPGAQAFVPDLLSIVSDRVHFGGKTFRDVVVGATRVGAAWRANVHAQGIDGYLDWAPGETVAPGGRLLARFTRLAIPDDRIADIEQLVEATPRSLPALDLTADELVLGGRPLGALQLRAYNDATQDAPVWRVQQLELKNEMATFDATGSWRARRGDARALSALQFTLTVADAGKLLALFDYRDVLRGGAGRMSGEVHWNGSPMRLDSHTLAGQIELALGKGQFLKSDPGIAKLIGVVNLQSLRRRLVFDFHDVFAEGFAFDEMNGTLHVRDGVASTDNFRMRGVAAKVAIRGEASIPAETQSLVVEVRPELNAGLASLAWAALANPALGLGSFVAQMILREPLQQIFSFEYDVTGPWDDPQVVRRERSVSSVADSPDLLWGYPGSVPAVQ